MSDLIGQLHAAMAAAEDHAYRLTEDSPALSAAGNMLLEHITAGRKILELHEPTVKTHEVYDHSGARTGETRTDYHCGTCGGRDWDLDPIGTRPCETLLALAEAYRIEVPA